MNDIVINKIQSIQRCIARAREEHAADPDGFDTNYTRQDAAVLNVLRACEQAIDLANHIIRTHRMGIPTSSTESFDLLRQAFVIDPALSEKLKTVVGFGATIRYECGRIDPNAAKSVIVSVLDDLIQFGDRIMEFVNDPSS